MNEDNGTHYPDSEPDTLGELKEIRRHERMDKHAPPIAWGLEYKSWSVEQRLYYAERLAASMNHAADILQQERDKQVEQLKHQDEQLKQAAQKYADQTNLLINQLTRHNAEQQKLNQIIVDLQVELTEQRKRIKALEHGPVD